MPEHLRGELSSKSFGLLLSNDTGENVRAVLEIVQARHPPKVIIVGDFTLRAFLSSGYSPDLGLFDKKVGRSESAFSIEITDSACNPAGSITDDAVSAIRRHLASGEKSLLFIDGEEDLLSLPCILYSPEGSIVVYGIPGEGMMVITVNKETKEKIKRIIARFERVD
jgi:hypothetical protein